MQFATHTEIPGGLAAVLFLLAADAWPQVKPEELARAFARSAVYDRALPDSWSKAGEDLRADKYGVLFRDAPESAGEAFYVRGEDRRGKLVCEIVGATTRDDLVNKWTGCREYHPTRPRRVDLDAAAQRYEGQHGEAHATTLAAAEAVGVARA